MATAGDSVRIGAEAARESYSELIVLQKEWFTGAELGLKGMKEQLQTIINAYGVKIDGQTTNLMHRWTEEVENCLSTYSSQVEELKGGLDELQAAISKLRK